MYVYIYTYICIYVYIYMCMNIYIHIAIPDYVGYLQQSVITSAVSQNNLH